jgi:hypothetical protein
MTPEIRYSAGTRYEAPRVFPEYSPDHEFRVLNWEDWLFWRDNGYLVIRDLIPKDQCEELIKVTCDFLGVQRDNPDSWYNIMPRSSEDPTPKSIAGMTELYHHQAIWNNRQFPKVYDVFFDLWGTEKLWTTIDRVNMNLPNQNGWDFGGFLHWDVELDQLLSTRNIQGVLSLNDNDTGMGGLQIIPTLFKQLESWLERQPKGRSRVLEEKVDFEVINVPSKAGDLVIWDTRMAHGTSPNRSTVPRFAQYLSMCPAEPLHAELLEIRLESFANQTRPEKSGNKISGTAGSRKESDFCPKAELTELGKRLLGVQPW